MRGSFFLFTWAYNRHRGRSRITWTRMVLFGPRSLAPPGPSFRRLFILFPDTEEVGLNRLMEKPPPEDLAVQRASDKRRFLYWS